MPSSDDETTDSGEETTDEVDEDGDDEEEEELVIPVRRETREKYEGLRVKCECKVPAFLDWSYKQDRCFYRCKNRICSYFRWFSDVYDEYVEEDDVMLERG